MRARRAALGLLPLLFLACSEAPRADGVRSFDGGPEVLSLPELFAAGEERAARRLGARAADVDRWAAAVVRVRVHEPRDDPDADAVVHSGSGVLVAGGAHALTAAHVLAPGGERATVEVVLADGRSSDAAATFPAEGVDLAVLHLARPFEDVACPPLDLAGATGSGEAVVLGYPARLGRDAAGRIAVDVPLERSPLLPLRVVVRLGPGEAAAPVAGAIPVGGMSGGPVLDLEGRLVALQRSVAELVEGGFTTWRLDVVRLAPLAEELRELGL